MLDRILRLSALFVAFSLIGILGILIYKGGPRLSWEFLTSYPSRFPESSGIRSALLGSVWVMSLTTAFSIPIGLSSAIFLSEFAPKEHRFFRFLKLNIANLAGVPSIIYGILGLTIFVRGLELNRTIIAGSLTLTLMALPTIIIVSMEALDSVPKHLRLSARALGASKWQTVRDHVIPAALPGLCTGILLSLSRVAGETAPLIMMGAMTFVSFDPQSIHDPFTVIPIQVYSWAAKSKAAFQETTAAGILVLLGLLFTVNIVALAIKYKYSSEKT
jgi:phosphate transport system permease protein